MNMNTCRIHNEKINTKTYQTIHQPILSTHRTLIVIASFMQTQERPHRRSACVNEKPFSAMTIKENRSTRDDGQPSHLFVANSYHDFRVRLIATGFINQTTNDLNFFLHSAERFPENSKKVSLLKKHGPRANSRY